MVPPGNPPNLECWGGFSAGCKFSEEGKLKSPQRFLDMERARARIRRTVVLVR